MPTLVNCGRAMEMPVSAMPVATEQIIRIAAEEFAKLVPDAVGLEVEEIENELVSGSYFVTLGYWMKDSKPTQRVSAKDSEQSALDNLLNPWRRRFKRVEVDPVEGRAVAIRMYEPSFGIS